ADNRAHMTQLGSPLPDDATVQLPQIVVRFSRTRGEVDEPRADASQIEQAEFGGARRIAVTHGLALLPWVERERGSLAFGRRHEAQPRRVVLLARPRVERGP